MKYFYIGSATLVCMLFAVMVMKEKNLFSCADMPGKVITNPDNAITNIVRNLKPVEGPDFSMSLVPAAIGPCEQTWFNNTIIHALQKSDQIFYCQYVGAVNQTVCENAGGTIKMGGVRNPRICQQKINEKYIKEIDAIPN